MLYSLLFSIVSKFFSSSFFDWSMVLAKKFAKFLIAKSLKLDDWFYLHVYPCELFRV